MNHNRICCRWGALLVIAIAVVPSAGRAQEFALDLSGSEVETPPSSAGALVPPTPVPLDGSIWQEARELARWIDERLAERWQTQGVSPAAQASDAQWMRRVYLDLAGSIPTLWEAREFLDRDDDRRYDALVEHLLHEPAFATHMAVHWRQLLMPEADSNDTLRFVELAMYQWLRNAFALGKSYDEIASEILGLDVSQVMRSPYEVVPNGFYIAKEHQPEQLAAGTARAFLGVRLECAQCHDHPFADWKQEQFWQFAAFFTDLPSASAGVGKIAIPETDRTVEACFPDGTAPQWEGEIRPRETLAGWVTSRENVFFARAAVNRLWAHLFGTGLVEPVDDIDPSNPPSHPEVLDRLAEEFVAHGYDIRFVLRALTSTEAYRRSSEPNHPSQHDLRQFAAMPVRGMQPLQLYESLGRAAGLPASPPQSELFTRGMTAQRQAFFNSFANSSESATAHETSVIQALTLMNGRIVSESSTLKDSRTLAAVIDYPGWDTAARIEALYLATLSRRPRQEELQRLIEYVDGDDASESDDALADVFWMLLNCSEFALNH